MKYKLSKLALGFIALMSFFVKAQGNMQEAEKALDVLMSDVINCLLYTSDAADD